MDDESSASNLAQAFCLGYRKLTPFGQAMFAKYLTLDFPFDRKIDNPTSADHIENIAFVSIQDEDYFDGERQVGVL